MINYNVYNWQLKTLTDEISEIEFHALWIRRFAGIPSVFDLLEFFRGLTLAQRFITSVTQKDLYIRS
jgi:hypothetical protein